MAKRKKSKSHHFPHLLIALGFLLLSLWGIHRFFYNRSLRLSETILTSFIKQDKPESIPVFLVTRGIRQLPVVESGKVNGSWIISSHAANHVQQSGVPGGGGNIIIYGHNTDDIFGPIRWLNIGDTITLTTANGSKYVYRVFAHTEVDPSQTAFLLPVKTEILTLYTCSGWFDSKRFVVRATPI